MVKTLISDTITFIYTCRTKYK